MRGKYDRYIQKADLFNFYVAITIILKSVNSIEPIPNFDCIHMIPNVAYRKDQLTQKAGFQLIHVTCLDQLSQR